jgi:hypothetical protein
MAMQATMSTQIASISRPMNVTAVSFQTSRTRLDGGSGDSGEYRHARLKTA